MRGLAARAAVLLVGTSLLVACAGGVTTPAGVPPDLGGTSWRLVKFQGGNGATLVPDDPAKYTVDFNADGSLTARIDCNRARGIWRSAGPSHLELGPMALTRAQCPPGSLHDRIVQDWGFVRSYVVRNDHLFLALMADAGIYEFEPRR